MEQSAAAFPTPSGRPRYRGSAAAAPRPCPSRTVRHLPTPLRRRPRLPDLVPASRRLRGFQAGKAGRGSGSLQEQGIGRPARERQGGRPGWPAAVCRSPLSLSLSPGSSQQVLHSPHMFLCLFGCLLREENDLNVIFHDVACW